MRHPQTMSLLLFCLIGVLMGYPVRSYVAFVLGHLPRTWYQVVVVVVVVVVAVVVVVVLTLTRIIKSVVTGQAPVTLELRNTPVCYRYYRCRSTRPHRNMSRARKIPPSPQCSHFSSRSRYEMQDSPQTRLPRRAPPSPSNRVAL